jgi:L-threonylcarbamoyladenylate synthase
VKRWQIDDEPSPFALDEIAAVLVAGGVVLMPTDTVYGLHAIPSSSSRIAAIKGRDEDKPFVTIASSVEQVERLGIDVIGPLRDL